ncbi:MAG: anaphase promoting complex subunit doc1 [Chaenotheca gracillima]|nr:MAG: anaphase promoting complex subunit doc1 [Chaenotheca gracillima]
MHVDNFHRRDDEISWWMADPDASQAASVRTVGVPGASASASFEAGPDISPDPEPDPRSLQTPLPTSAQARPHYVIGGTSVLLTVTIPATGAGTPSTAQTTATSAPSSGATGALVGTSTSQALSSGTPTPALSGSSNGLGEGKLIAAIVVPVVVVLAAVLAFFFCFLLPRRKKKRLQANAETKNISEEAFHDQRPVLPPIVAPQFVIDNQYQATTGQLPSTTVAPSSQSANIGLAVSSSATRLSDVPPPYVAKAADETTPLQQPTIQTQNLGKQQMRTHQDNDLVSPFSDPDDGVDENEHGSDPVSPVTTGGGHGRHREQDNVSIVSDLSSGHDHTTLATRGPV